MDNITEKTAYLLGRKYAKYGKDKDNYNCIIFNNEKLRDAWERGKEDYEEMLSN